MPALIDEGSRIAIQRTAPGPFAQSLRIDYHEIRPGLPTRIRFVICRFASERTARGGRELTGLATEFGPMADASFYLLKRFYLEARDAPPVDPAPPGAYERLPAAPLWLAYGAQQLLASLPGAAIYALLAAAYALIYGLVGRITLVFGEFAALASLAGVAGVAVIVSLGQQTALAGALVALLVGVGAAAIHGLALSRLAMTRLSRARGQHVLIASVGAGIALSEWLRLVQGAETRWLPPILNQPIALMRSGDFVTTVTLVGLGAALIGLGATAALIVFMQRSRYGRPGGRWPTMRGPRRCSASTSAMSSTAPSSWRRAGRARGRDHDRALWRHGLRGRLRHRAQGADRGDPGRHRLDRRGGAGRLVVAGIEAVWSATLPIEHRDAVIYLLLAVVLIFRPGGFFGRQDLQPRRD